MQVLLFFIFLKGLFVLVSPVIFLTCYFLILIHRFLVKFIKIFQSSLQLIDLYSFAIENYFSVTAYSLKEQFNFVMTHSISPFSVSLFILSFHELDILQQSYHFEPFLATLWESIFSSRYFNKESLFLFCLDYLMESRDSYLIAHFFLCKQLQFSYLLNFIEND